MGALARCGWPAVGQLRALTRHWLCLRPLDSDLGSGRDGSRLLLGLSVTIWDMGAWYSRFSPDRGAAVTAPAAPPLYKETVG